MYTQLLGTALDERQHTRPPTAGEALAEFVVVRGSLDAGTSFPGGLPGALTDVAGQLAYDIALVRLARSVGIVVTLSGFDQPRVERDELEGQLRTLGLRLR